MINRKRFAVTGPTTVCMRMLKVNTKKPLPSGNSEVALVESSKLTEYRCISHASFTQHNTNEEDMSFLAELCCKQHRVLPHYYSQPWNKLFLSHYYHTVKYKCFFWHSVLEYISPTSQCSVRLLILEPEVQKMYQTLNGIQLPNRDSPMY